MTPVWSGTHSHIGVCCLHSCTMMYSDIPGVELVGYHLMTMEEVQSFMYGISGQALHADRSTYPPGALRKVQNS